MQRKGRYQRVNDDGDEDNEDNDNDNTEMMTTTEVDIPSLGALSSSMALDDEAASASSISAEETLLFVKQRNKRRRRHNITIRLSVSFWILGLLNNTGYVIMIAAAKSISEGGVALVFLANILPALVVKGTAPYWFDYVSYKTRITVASFLMVTSFALIASSSSSLPWQLTGVAFTSAQGALGEASLLALAGKIDGAIAIAIAASESNNNTEDENNTRRRKQQRQHQQVVVNDTIGSHQQCDIDEENDVNHSANINQNVEYIINNNDQNDQQQQQQQQQHQDAVEEKGRCLTGFSSGTGFAGVFGFFWKWFWNKWLGLSLSTTLWLATILAVLYLFAYRYVTYLQKQQQSIMTTVATTRTIELVESSQRQEEQKQRYRDRVDDDHEGIIARCDDNNDNNNSNNDPEEEEEEVNNESSVIRLNENSTLDNNNNDYDSDDRNDNNNNSNGIEDKLDVETMMVKEISTMNGRQRFHLVLSLWPYMIPLFLVYVAEYTLQSGTWTAIGFPVTDRESRDMFYEYSNWMYQAGVFFSRSSGSFFLAPMAVLWLMPILQVINVGIYWAIAANQQHNNFDDNNGDDSGGFFYGPTFLYSAAFYTGLLGGAVYIHGYLRICRDLPLAHREFALSATSLAECLGIVVADFFGLLVQACLYRINDLEGAVISCPSSFN
jgi:hypothetical protein